jgi:hypothetical protein
MTFNNANWRMKQSGTQASPAPRQSAQIAVIGRAAGRTSRAVTREAVSSLLVDKRSSHPGKAGSRVSQARRFPYNAPVAQFRGRKSICKFVEHDRASAHDH